MRRVLVLLAVLLPFFTPALLATEHITIDGETFSREFVGGPPNGDKLIEFVRESESIDKWTRLVGYRYQHLPGMDNDPVKVAQGVAQVVKASHPEGRTSIIANPKDNEALLDFLILSPDKTFMEFNVFRYARSLDGSAVVSLQLAYRFDDVSPEGTERFKKLRASWIEQAVRIDMKLIHDALK
jgi:hypothetical protein